MKKNLLLSLSLISLLAHAMDNQKLGPIVRRMTEEKQLVSLFEVNKETWDYMHYRLRSR